MKPFIGITMDFQPQWLEGRPWHAHMLLVDYTSAVRLAGGVPVPLPLAHPDIGPAMLERLDGLMFTGGPQDVPPAAYGQEPHLTTQVMATERWQSDVAWLHYALAAQKPVLAVCLGMQLANVVLGGSLIQDIPSQVPDAHQHSSTSRMYQHQIELLPGSWLAAAAPSPRVTVTSAHHQALDRLFDGCVVTARSDDGIIEAFEAPERGILAATQWHPERNLVQPDWLLEAFVRACQPATAPERTGAARELIR